jgi:hypothetical protein
VDSGLFRRHKFKEDHNMASKEAPERELKEIRHFSKEIGFHVYTRREIQVFAKRAAGKHT